MPPAQDRPATRTVARPAARVRARWLASSTALLIGLAPAAQAQTDDDAPGTSPSRQPRKPGTIVLAPVVLRSDTGLQLSYGTPGAISTISGDEIERFPGTSPADMFKDDPGVVSGEARNSGGIDVNIRGLQGYDRVTTTIDGAQQNSSSDRGYFGDSNRTFIDPDLIGGATITKGASNSASGSGAIGGEVALRTITADDIIPEGQEWGVRLRFGAQSNTTSAPPALTQGGLPRPDSIIYVESNDPFYPVTASPPEPAATGRPGLLQPTGGNGSIAIARRTERFEIVAALAYRESGNYFAGTRGDSAKYVFYAGGEQRVIVDKNYKANLDEYFPGNTIEIGDELYSRYMFLRNTGISDYRAGEEVFNTERRSKSGLVKARFFLNDENTVEFGYMRNDLTFGFIWPSSALFLARPEQAIPSRASVDTVTARYHYQPAGSNLVDITANAWLTRQEFNEKWGYSWLSYSDDASNVTRMLGFDIANTSSFESRAGRIEVEVGAAYLAQNVRKDRFRYEAIVQTDIDERLDRRQWDVFANAAWLPNDWLTVRGGLRYKAAKNDIRQTSITNNPDFPSFDSRRSHNYSGVMPSLLLAAEPASGFQIYAGYKSGIRFPSLTEGVDYVPGSWPGDLRPEESRTYEAGLNYIGHDIMTGGDQLGLKLNYFNTKISDYIVMQFGTGANAGGVTTKNWPEAHFSGVEISGQYDSSRMFGKLSATLYDRVRLCPSKTSCYSSDDPGGIPFSQWRNQVPPEFAASATIGRRFLDERLTIGGRVTYTGDRFDSRQTYGLDRSTYWGDYTLVDLFGSYDFQNNMRLDIAVENVTDRFYVDALAMSRQPGPGRTMRVNFSTKF